MKHLLLLTTALLLTIACFGQTYLTEEDWNSIPPEVRAKLEKVFAENSKQFSDLARKLNKEIGDYTIMVEDGQTYTAVPANSVFTQVARDRQAPPEGNYVFSRWSDMTDVNSTYISPELFRMMKQLPKIHISGRHLDLSGIVQDLKGLYLLDFARYRKGDPNVSYCRNTTAGGLRRDIRTFLDNGGYQTLMDQRENGQYTRLYIATKDHTVTGFVLVNLDDSFDYGRFVCFEGCIPKEKFEEIIRKTLK